MNINCGTNLATNLSTVFGNISNLFPHFINCMNWLDHTQKKAGLLPSNVRNLPITFHDPGSQDRKFYQFKFKKFIILYLVMRQVHVNSVWRKFCWQICEPQISAHHVHFQTGHFCKGKSHCLICHLTVTICGTTS